MGLRICTCKGVEGGRCGGGAYLVGGSDESLEDGLAVVACKVLSLLVRRVPVQSPSATLLHLLGEMISDGCLVLLVDGGEVAARWDKASILGCVAKFREHLGSEIWLEAAIALEAMLTLLVRLRVRLRV